MDKLLTQRELAERLKTSVSTVFRLTRSGEIPCYYIGSLPRYDLQEVFEALRFQTKKEKQREN